jgi:hypothetical protein
VLRQDRSLSSGADDRDAHHPLGIGEILDTGIKIYRANAATLIKLVIVVVAPVAAVGELITASADSRSSISFDRAPERMNGLRGAGRGASRSRSSRARSANVLRLVDFLSTMYLTGIVPIFVTRRTSASGTSSAGRWSCEPFAAAKPSRRSSRRRRSRRPPA